MLWDRYFDDIRLIMNGPVIFGRLRESSQHHRFRRSLVSKSGAITFNIDQVRTCRLKLSTVVAFNECYLDELEPHATLQWSRRKIDFYEPLNSC